ncbi:hypothetical protein ACIOWA_26825, partial [Pseudomonas sp. NPDC087614]
HCDVEPGSAAADREKSGIVRRRRDNNLEKRRNLWPRVVTERLKANGPTSRLVDLESHQKLAE